MENATFWIGLVVGGLGAAVPLIAYIVGKTPTKKDDEVLKKALDVIERLAKKDLDGDGKIGSE